MNNTVFWGVTTYGLVESHRRFGGTNCLNLGASCETFYQNTRRRNQEDPNLTLCLIVHAIQLAHASHRERYPNSLKVEW
jgi:hypothetical protein